MGLDMHRMLMPKRGGEWLLLIGMLRSSVSRGEFHGGAGDGQEGVKWKGGEA